MPSTKKKTKTPLPYWRIKEGQRNTTQVNFRLRPDEIARVTRHARKLGLSRNQWLVEVVLGAIASANLVGRDLATRNKELEAQNTVLRSRVAALTHRLKG